MPFRDVVQNLGDALAGVDREAAYRKGMAERADIDQTEAQTEAAMQLARDRRMDAEKKERQRAAEEALREQAATLNDPNALSGVDVMAAGMGDEYAGLQLGRTRAQDFQQSETIATPSQMFGDEIMTPQQSHEGARIAAMEAQAPASALASRRTGNQPMEIVIDDQGNTIYMPRAQAAGERVGARPSTAQGAAGNAGGLPASVSSLIFREASALYGGTYDPLTGRFAGLDREGAANVQRIASRASVIFKGGGVDPQTAIDQALEEARALEPTGGIPPQFGDALEQIEDVDPSTGQPWAAIDPATGRTVIWINGQWVDQPVQ